MYVTFKMYFIDTFPFLNIVAIRNQDVFFNEEFYIAYAIVFIVVIYLVYGWRVVGWFVNFVDVWVMCTLLRDVTNISTSTDFMK